MAFVARTWSPEPGSDREQVVVLNTANICSHEVGVITPVRFGLFVARSRGSGFLIPQVSRAKVPNTSDWRVLVGWPELFGEAGVSSEALTDELRDRLSQIGRFRGLRLITAINCIALDRGVERMDIQFALANEFSKTLPTAAGAGLVGLVSSGRIFLSAEQLAVLAGLIIRHGVVDEPRGANDATTAFVEAALIVNELYGREQIALRDAALLELTPLFPDDPRAAALESFLPMEIRAAAFDTEPLDNLLWRIRSFVEWSRAQGANANGYCDVDGAFQSIFGLTYEEVLTAGLWVQAYFKSIQNVADLQGQDPILNTDLIAAPLVDKRALRYVGATSIPLEELVAELEGRDRMTAAALLALQRRPLVEVGAAHFACPVPAFLRSALGIGLFHRLAEHFGATGHRIRFYAFFARFLQQYAESIVATSVDATTSKMVSEFPYRVGKKAKRSSDFVLIEGRSALFFDVCNKRLHTENSINEASLSAIQHDVDEMIVAQAKQLHGRIADFKAGHYTIDGRLASDFDEIVPVAVTHQSIHGWAGTRAYIDRRLRECGYLQSGPRLEIASLAELETLVQAFAGDLSLAVLFARRRMHADLVARGRSLNNYLLLHGEWDGKDRRRIPGLDEWLKSTIEAQLRSWGIEVTPEGGNSD